MGNKIEILLELGLNRLEAEVYLFLLTNEPSTAYRIGKGLNKPTANVYKAIESLAIKGAVLVEDNKNRVCKAVSVNEFLNQYEKSIVAKTADARLELNQLEVQSPDERSYSLESVSLVFERFEQMMERCTTIAVIDAFPLTLERVVHSIEKAIARGISVYIESYQPISIPGADIANVTVGKQTLQHWQSQQLNLVIDGEEHLIALMDNKLKKVKQAVWSSNTYVSCMLHAGFLREQTVIKIMEASEKPNFEKNTRLLLDQQKFFFNSNIPGFNKLQK